MPDQPKDAAQNTGFTVTSAEVVATFSVPDRAAIFPEDTGERLIDSHHQYLQAGNDAKIAGLRLQNALAGLIDALCAAQRLDEAEAYLTTYAYLQARVRYFGIRRLLADYEQVFQDAPQQAWTQTRHLYECLIAAEPILRVAPSQLPQQILARLRPRLHPRLEQICSKIQDNLESDRLWPLTANFSGNDEGTLRILESHKGMPSAVAFFPDGSAMVSADSHEVLMWNLDTYTVIAALKGHDEEVTDLTVTPNCRFVVAALRAPSLAFWSLGDDGRLAWLHGHSGTVREVVALPNSDILSVGTDGALFLWQLDTARGECIGKVSDALRTIAAVPGTSLYLTASGSFMSRESTITLWHIGNREIVDQYVLDVGEIQSVAITQDRMHVLAASGNRLLQWNLNERSQPSVVGQHEARIAKVRASLSGNWAVTADTSGQIRYWDLEASSRSRSLRGHRILITGLAASTNEMIATASYDRTIRIQRCPPPNDVNLPIHQSPVISLAIGVHGGRLVGFSGAEDGTIIMWRLPDCREDFRINAHAKRLSSLTFGIDQGWLLSTGWDGTVALWSISTGELIKRIECAHPHVQWAVLGPDEMLVTVTWEGVVDLWSVQTGRRVSSLETNIGNLCCALLDSHGELLIFGTRQCLSLHLPSEKTQQDWSVTEINTSLTPQTASDSRTPINAVTALCFDCCLIATARGDIHVYDTNRKAIVSTWRDSSCGIADVVASADGRWVTTVSGIPLAESDNTLRVWDAQNGSVIARFTGDCPFRSCAMSPPGDLICAGDQWGRVHLFKFMAKPSFIGSIN
jgi:WD40 repeat protein